MRNDTKLNVNGLLTMGQDAAAGAALLGPILMLAQNTAGAINLALNALRLARDNHDTGKQQLKQQRAEVNVVVVAARVFLTLFREMLKLIYGKRYSRLWDEAGFVGLLAIPKRAEDLQPRLQKAAAFLLAHPEREVPALKITAVEALALFTKLSTARTKVNEHKAGVDGLLDLRNKAASVVRHRIRGLIQELSHILTPLDPRWKTFGFNQPGAKATPDAPQNVSSERINHETIALKWDTVPNADHYRVWKRAAEVDAEFVPAGSPSDPDFTLENLSANVPLEIVVSAVNAGGESVRSQLLKITMPLQE